MGNVFHDLQPTNSFTPEKIDRVRVRLGEDGNQHIPGIDLFFPATLHMADRPLQNPVKGHRLRGLAVDFFGDRHPGFEKPFKTFFDVLVAAAAFVDNVPGEVVMQQPVEHVLNGDVLVTMGFRFFDRFNQGEFQFFTQHGVFPRGVRSSPGSSATVVSVRLCCLFQQSFSKEQRRGN